MIDVTAKYFAAFRDKAGQASEARRTSATTAGGLYQEVAQAHGFSDTLATCKVAINDEFATWDTPLANGDVVLFFPPVGGG